VPGHGLAEFAGALVCHWQKLRRSPHPAALRASTLPEDGEG
jgi:hypothetical protein